MADFFFLWSFGAVAWIAGTLILALIGAWLTWRDWAPELRDYAGHVPPRPMPAHGPNAE